MAQHSSHPTTAEGLKYQLQPYFRSALAVGGPAPDGACHRLDGSASTLLAELHAERPTILSFGSAT